MNAKTKEEIQCVFDETDTDFPDKSTEFVLEITAQRVRERQIKRDCDAGDVAEAVCE